MLEILESPKHLVAMKFSGEMTADDVAKAYEAANKALENNERISFYAEVDDSVNITFEGLVKDITESFGQLGKLSKYYRAAVVTDKGWIAALARVEGVVFSSIDVRVFGLDEKDKALYWASEAPEPVIKPADPDASIKFLQTTSAKVLAYEVDGKLREKDIKNAVAHAKELFVQEGKVNILGRFKNFNGFDLLAVFDDDLIKLKYQAMSKVEKYALVGPSPWLRNFLELMDPIFSVEIRVFDESDEAAAWDWVGASQALLTE